MATVSASRPQLTPPIAAALAFALMPLAARGASLAAPNCTAAGGDLTCRLASVLHILYIIAAILAFVLVAVIVLAVHIYRKNNTADEQRRP